VCDDDARLASVGDSLFDQALQPRKVANLQAKQAGKWPSASALSSADSPRNAQT
jgi:hypothetical protein